MTDRKDLPPEFSDLRRRAEERLKAEAISPEELSRADAVRLIHELQVYQIELEMQNEELRLNQARLEESRSKYADLYDFAPVGYLTLDQQGRIEEANLTAANVLGVARESLPGRLFTHFLEEADRLSFYQLLTNPGYEPEQRLEVRLQGGNGSGRIMLLDILLVRDDQDREQRRIAMTDISELKHTQEELRLHKEDLEELVAQRVVELVEVNHQLRQSNEKLQAVIDHCPLAIVPLDPHGLVQGWNPAAERMFGWRADEAIGGFPPMVPEEKRDERAEILRRSLQGEQITGLELRRQRKDGTWIDVSLSVAPLRDEQGEISGLVGILEDITARKQAEETLKTQAMVLENMAEGVTVTDDRGHILFTNPAFDAMFGYEPGELAGRHSHILSHYPPEENTRVVKAILKAVDSAGVWSGEFRNRRKDGSLLLTASRISAIKAGGKNLFISVQEDITARKAGEEALRAANERLQALINACPLAIMSLDTNGLVTAWNPAAERLFGWREQEVLGHPLPTVPEDAKEELEDMLRTQREGNFFHGKELRRLRRDGTPVEVRLYSAPLRNSQGAITGFIGALEDITERKRAEDVLRRQAELLDLAHDAILVRDLTGRIIFWNQGATELYGFTPEEALGQLTFELLQTEFPVPLADIEAQILKEGSWQGVLRQTTKDGRRLVISSSRTLRRDEEGRPQSILVINTDITERQRAEEALRESEARFRKIFENAATGIAIVDWEGHYQQFNPAYCNLTGYAGEELLELNFVSLVHPEDREVNLAEFRRLKAGEVPFFETENRLIRKDGRSVWVHKFISVLTDAAGKPSHLLGLITDTTERKQAEQAIRESEARERARAAEVQALFDAVPALVLLAHDPQARNITGNSLAYDFFGVPPGGNISKSAPEEERPGNFRVMKDGLEIPPEELPVRRAARGEPVRNYELDIVFTSGDRHSILGNAIPLRDDSGNPRGAVSAFIDITARKQAEEALRRSEEKYRTLFNSIDEGFCIVEVIFDETGKAVDYRFLEVNPSFVRQTGITDAKGKTIRELAPEFEAHWFEVYGRVALTGEPARFQARAKPLHRWFDVYAFRFGPPQDRQVAILFNDITARKRTEDALKERTERYELVVAGAHAGIWDWDVLNHRVFYSPQWKSLYGFGEDEVVDRPENWSKGIHPDDAPRVFTALQDHFAGSTPVFAQEYRIICRDGSIKWVAERGIAQRDALGRVVRMAGSATDITARKRGEAELARQKELLEAIIDNIPVMLTIYDPELKTIRLNQEFRKVVGWTEEDLPADDPLAPLYSDFEYRAQVRQYMQSLEPGWRDLLVTAKDGSRVDSTWANIRLADNTFIGIGIDIRERKAMEKELRRARDELERRVEERTRELQLAYDSLRSEMEKHQRTADRLRESEARFSAFMRHLPGIAVMRDTQGRYLFANNTWEHLLGKTKEDWLGKTVAEIWPADLAREFSDLDHHILATGQSSESIKELDLAEGRKLNLTYNFPILDDSGLPYMVGAIGIDITERRRAEEARAEERQRFFSLLETMPAFVALLAPDYSMPFVNQEFVRRFGEPEAGRPCYLGLFGRAEPCPDCRTFQVLETNQPQEWEWLGPDGRNYAVYDYPFTDTDGSRLVLEMGVDITRRKLAEEALAKNEAMLRLILDTLPVGVWVVDKHGRIVQSNPAARSIWGGALYVDREQYGEYKAWWADTGRRLNPEEWGMVRALRQGEACLGEVMNIQGFDGSRKTIINSAVPLLGEDGEILGGIAVNEDITNLKRAEKVMLQQARQVEAFFSHNITPLVFLDPEFNFLRVNEAYARACQRDAQEFIGRNHFELYPNPEVEAIFRRVVETKASYVALAKPFEFPDHPEWGVTYWDWSLAPVLDEFGEVDFLIFSLNDVTERKRAELEAERQNALIAGINGIFREALVCETEEDLAATCLAVAEELTGSRYGFIDEVNEEGNLAALAFSGAVLEQCSLITPGDAGALPNLKPRGLLAKPIETGEPIIANDPARHADARGLPPGHPPLTSYLGVPLKRGDKVIGLLRLGNKEGGYDHRDLEDMENLAGAIVEAWMRKRAETTARRQAAIVEGINRIFREAMTCETLEDLGRVCLGVAEDLSGSRFSFIDLINDDGTLDLMAVSDAGRQACRQTGKRKFKLPAHVPVRGFTAASLKVESP